MYAKGKERRKDEYFMMSKSINKISLEYKKNEETR